jgi:hypothetical protein
MISRFAEAGAGGPARRLKCRLCDEPDAKTSKSARMVASAGSILEVP